MKKLLILLVAIITAALVIGCGGGGGGSHKDKPATVVTLAGKVVNEDGKAQSGIKVQVFSPIDETPIDQCTTDKEGEYIFDDIPAGIYKIIAFKEGFTYIGWIDYKPYENGVTTKNITINPYKISKSAFKDDFVFASGSTKSYWSPVDVEYKTTDGRTVVIAFSEKDSNKGDSEKFNFYAKFSDGSISKIQGTIKNEKLKINKEIPVCNAKLTDFSKGDFTVTASEPSLMFLDGLGTYIASTMVVSGSDITFTTSTYVVSPEFGMFVEYNVDSIDTFRLISIDD